MTSSPSPFAHHWDLDPAVDFLNHGSFGATPRAVLAAQARVRARMEAQPVRFFVRELPGLLDAARDVLADFLGADAADLAFVPNATAGVNAVVRALDLAPGDELVATDHEYNASRNALAYAAERAGARVVTARVPYPLAGDDDVVEAVLAALTPRTRLVLLDHVTSQTALVFPVARVCAALRARGVRCLVDGAHGPGMLPLALRALDADYYTGNCHKWLCAPKGAAFLYVRRELQPGVRPTSISHGANTPRPGRSRFHTEFDWTGTADPSAYLCVPDALAFLGALVPGGVPAVMARNRAAALAARAHLAARLGVALPCPDAMVGAMATLPLPDGDGRAPATPLYDDPLQAALDTRHGIEVPVIPWPAAPRRLLRISAQLYNHPAQYARLGDALAALLADR